MARIKNYKFVQGFIDRHGRPRYYFRRPGCKRMSLPGLYGSAEFAAAYEAASNGEAAPRLEIAASRSTMGTVHWLVASYLDCAKGSTSPFKMLALETQRTRRNILENFRKEDGDKRIFRTEPSGKRVMLLTREHMQAIINKKTSTPFAQRNMLHTIRAMFQWGVDEGKVPDDPTLGVKRVKAKTDGYATWTEEHIEQFVKRHPLGTKAYLALMLLLETAQRRGDVVRMGRQHIRKGTLSIVQGKTGMLVEIPVTRVLQAAIDAAPNNHLTFLVTSFGQSFTAAGFTNWFRSRCNEAKLPNGLSAHGLRKARARRLADKGRSAHEIAAVTGHVSIAEVQRYTRAANRRKLAAQAMSDEIDMPEIRKTGA